MTLNFWTSSLSYIIYLILNPFMWKGLEVEDYCFQSVSRYDLVYIYYNQAKCVKRKTQLHRLLYSYSNNWIYVYSYSILFRTHVTITVLGMSLTIYSTNFNDKHISFANI